MPISLKSPESKEQLIRLLPLVALLVISVLLASGLFERSVMEPKRSYMVGNNIRDFEIPSLTNQRTVSLSTLKGKIVVVNFFASWCEGCMIEHPALMKMAATGQVEMVGIAWKDKPDKALAWLKKHGNPYHQIGIDSRGATTIAFAVTGLPETFILDHKGVVAYHYKAPITDEIVNTVLLPMVEHLQNEYAANPSR